MEVARRSDNVNVLLHRHIPAAAGSATGGRCAKVDEIAVSMDSVHYLRPAMVPRSIAVIGASPRHDSLGRFVYTNVMAAGFKGDVYAVNPRHRTIDGNPCLPSIAALPTKVDLAVVVTGQQNVPGIIDDAGRKGIPAMLVLSPGLCEEGPERRRLERDVVERARAARVRVMGPNCLGLMRPDIGLNASWAKTMARPGGLALVSQSGAVTTSLLDYAWTAGFGFSSVVATGAESDVSVAEILDFLAGDAATRSILLYLEGIENARPLMSSIRVAASVKPVIVLKAGRHAAGARVVMSHTGALVGNDAVFDAALRRVGAVRVPRIGQLFGAAEALAGGRLPRGNRLAIVSNGTGPGALAADAAEENHVELAKLSDATQAALDAALPPNWSHANPVDVLADSDAERMATALKLLIDDRANDGVLVLFAPTPKVGAEQAARAMLPIAAAAEKPVVSAWLGEKDAGRGRAAFKAASMPALQSPERGVEAFSYLAQYIRNRELRLQVPPPRVDELKFDVQAARRIIDSARSAGRHTLDEQDSKALLASFGIETAMGLMARSAMEARQAAQQLGFPVVLKVRADGITHKSDVGGVILGVQTPDEVERGFDDIARRLAERAPSARFVGVLVQKMVVRPQGRELIVGLTRDPNFGPVVSFGMGGLAVEIFRDSAVALPPLNAFLARDLISRTRVSRMLDAFRGAPAVDLEKLIEVIVRVSELACEIPAVRELDINPLLADAQGVIALDARVQVSDEPLAADATYSHLAIHPYPRALAREVTVKGGRDTAAADPAGRRRGRAALHQPTLAAHLVPALPCADPGADDGAPGALHADRLRPRDGVRRDRSRPDEQHEIRGISPLHVQSGRQDGRVRRHRRGRLAGARCRPCADAGDRGDGARARARPNSSGSCSRTTTRWVMLMRKRGYAPHRDDEDPGILRYIKPLRRTGGPVAQAEPA